MKRTSFLLLAVFLSALLSGCAMLGNPSPEKKYLTEQYDDATIKTGITSALLKKSPEKANDLNVQCFRGHVFLIGEADKDFRAFAVATAKDMDDVVHVTTHWFPTGTAATTSDADIEATINNKLSFTSNAKAQQIVVDVWGSNVVLTGLVPDQAAIDRTLATAKQVEGVQTVTSYLAVF